VTLALVGVALAFILLPDAATLLEYDRVRVTSHGEWWRLFSGQLVHWNTRMAFLDLGFVLLLGVWAESTRPRTTRAVLLFGLPFVGVGIHLGAPGLLTYRGASGLASALLVLVALVIAVQPGRRWVRASGVAVLALLALKLLVEFRTGQAVFAGPLPEGVEVTPLAHLLGAGVALGVFLTVRSPKE
jgi:rhomboid family GlyGly-CTERM serine protease